MRQPELSDVEPEKFAIDGYGPTAWGVDRHGTFEYVLQRDDYDGMTRYAIVAVTPVGSQFAVDVIAGAEQSGTYARQLVEQTIGRGSWLDEADGWFADARARADSLDRADLTNARLPIHFAAEA